MPNFSVDQVSYKSSSAYINKGEIAEAQDYMKQS